jgi:seryl-tRNA synthetase
MDILSNLVKQIDEQKNVTENLRQQLQDSDDRAIQSNQETLNTIEAIIIEERQRMTEEGKQLLSQITSLVHSSTETGADRIANSLLGVSGALRSSQSKHAIAADNSNQSINTLSKLFETTIEDTARSMVGINSRKEANLQVKPI